MYVFIISPLYLQGPAGSLLGGVIFVRAYASCMLHFRNGSLQITINNSTSVSTLQNIKKKEDRT